MPTFPHLMPQHAAQPRLAMRIRDFGLRHPMARATSARRVRWQAPAEAASSVEHGDAGER